MGRAFPIESKPVKSFRSPDHKPMLGGKSWERRLKRCVRVRFGELRGVENHTHWPPSALGWSLACDEGLWSQGLWTWASCLASLRRSFLRKWRREEKQVCEC